MRNIIIKILESKEKELELNGPGKRVMSAEEFLDAKGWPAYDIIAMEDYADYILRVNQGNDIELRAQISVLKQLLYDVENNLHDDEYEVEEWSKEEKMDFFS